MTVVQLFPFWDDPTQSWDTLYLAGRAFPGIVDIDGEVSRDVEVKKAKDQDGATLKDNGYEPAKIEITIRVSTREQWQSLQGLIPDIHPRTKGGARAPVSIGHPAPNLLGVNQIYVTKIGFPKVLDTKEIKLAITAIEWLPEPKGVKTGAGTGGGGGGGGGGGDGGNLLDDYDPDNDWLNDEGDGFILSEEEAEEEEARRKWQEERDSFGDTWGEEGMTDEERKAFEDEYKQGQDPDAYEETTGGSEDTQENVEELADTDDEGSWW